MADIPEGLDDLLNSIRGEGKSSGSSALAVIPKPEKKESDSVENEDIDPRILKLLGLEDVFDIDYDTYKTLLRERMAAGRMPDSKIPTEEVQLLTDEFKRVKSKTGRFKVKGQKIKKESFVGKKKPTVTKAIKALPGRVTPKDTVDAEVITPEGKEPIDEVLGQLALKLNKVDENVKKIINTSVEKEKEEKETQDDERIETDKEKKSAKEKKRESAGITKVVSGVVSKAMAPAKATFDFLNEFFKKFLFATVIAEIIRFLKNPIEYFRPIVEWINSAIVAINKKVASVITSTLQPINDALTGFNQGLSTIQNSVNGIINNVPGLKHIIPPLDLGQIPLIPIQKIIEKVTIPQIPYPAKGSAVSQQSGGQMMQGFAGMLSGLFGMTQSSPQGQVLSTGPANFSGNTNQEKAMNYFMSQGLTKEQAAGIVGNLMQESTANLDPRADNKMGNLGIAQWDANRWSRFKKWAKTKNLSIYNLEAQLQWVMEELNTGDGGLGIARFKRTKTAAEATALFLKDFERSGEKPGDPGYENRIRNAENLMRQQFQGQGTSQSTGIKPSQASAAPPGPPSRRIASALPLNLNTGTSNEPAGTATPNQKQVPIFSAKGNNPYDFATAGTYNLLGALG